MSLYVAVSLPLQCCDLPGVVCSCAVSEPRSPVRQLWEVVQPGPVAPPDLSQLLSVPHGGATSGGLHENVCVSLLFIAAWLGGRGQFVYRGKVEDSATAEISRSQLWQWCRHRVSGTADSGLFVNRKYG